MQMKNLMLMLVLSWTFMLFAAEKVVPRQRYRAEFEIRATKNVYPADFRHQGVKLEYPGLHLQFVDGKGRKFTRLGRGDFFNVHSSEFVPGAIEFYTGEGVRHIKTVTRNAEIRNFRIVPVPPKENLAITLDCRVSGQIRDYFITPGEPGKAFFDVTVGKIYGDLIPITGGKRYKLTVIGYKGARDMVIGLEFYTHDRGGKSSSVRASRSQIRIGGRKQRLDYTFLAPAKARWLRATMTRGVVQDYQVREVK